MLQLLYGVKSDCVLNPRQNFRGQTKTPAAELKLFNMEVHSKLEHVCTRMSVLSSQNYQNSTHSFVKHNSLQLVMKTCVCARPQVCACVCKECNE